jgi:hypothetical protein
MTGLEFDAWSDAGQIEVRTQCATGRQLPKEQGREAMST